MNRRQWAWAAGAAAASVWPTPAVPRGVKPLRIVRVTTTEVRGVPTGKGLVLPWDPKRIPRDTRDYVITQFFTDQGFVSTTMDGDYNLPPGIAAEVQKRTEAYFIGKDPFEIELHFAEFFRKQKAPVRLLFLEIGLWDLIGKAVGQPLYRLWGAPTNRVKAYADTVHFDKTPEQRAEDALRFYEDGFRAIKIRFHHADESKDMALARAVIRAVGGKMDVMVDANQATIRPTDPPPVWDLSRAIRVARELEELGVYWLEEPLNRYAYEDLAKVRKELTRMHLAGGQTNSGMKEFLQFLIHGSYSYLQPDPVTGAPVSVMRKIAVAAEAFGVLFGPHHGKSGVGLVANLHLHCAAPNTGHIEYMYDPGYWNPEGFQAGFAQPYPVDKEGYLHAPASPGLGIEWDKAFFQRHGLHYG
jgi:D-galactarolactone cycloisomerase